MIILNNKYGRLGNNIKQLSNIIDIAIEYKHNVKFNINIDFLDLSIIEKYFYKYNNDEIIKDESLFYYKEKLPFPNEIYIKNIEERNEILRSAFLINNINKLNENDLVIHIRSGDIFCRGRGSGMTTHNSYVPPPLSYYIKEINKFKYEKIYIICEDTINPVVNELLKLYDNIVYKKNTLEEDIRIILGATNIVFSIGTFIPSLMLLSNNIKYIYGEETLNKELEEYYKFMKPWNNTVKQCNYILTYGRN
jgi:hypothetical protein